MGVHQSGKRGSEGRSDLKPEQLGFRQFCWLNPNIRGLRKRGTKRPFSYRVFFGTKVGQQSLESPEKPTVPPGTLNCPKWSDGSLYHPSPLLGGGRGTNRPVTGPEPKIPTPAERGEQHG
jgi:hypothetical protein